MKTLRIKIPNLLIDEQKYILKILLYEFLGLDFEVDIYEGDKIEISSLLDSKNSSILSLDASFFKKANFNWLNSLSMPVLPLLNWCPKEDGINANLVNQNFPVLYGSPGIVKNNKGIHLNIDIFGSAFFMLTRYEEAVIKERDGHNRFSFKYSLAYKENFLNRPIINEYLEILYECLKYLWPNTLRKKLKFRRFISCDVDHPFDLAGFSIKKTVLRVGARLLRDKNPKLALLDFFNFIFKKFNSDFFDQYINNINWIMKVNKSYNNIVTFNFIPLQTNKNEAIYDFQNKKILSLIEHIVNYGHMIGFHPGYNTYNSKKKFQDSVNIFKKVCKDLNLITSKLGGRQHYLRFDICKTPKLWSGNNFYYDSSLGYSDQPGFRCGTCYEYSMFDLNDRTALQLKQRPLIIMENSIINNNLKKLDNKNSIINNFDYYIDICKQYNGDFTLLWHNSSFQFSESFKIYKKIISRN